MINLSRKLTKSELATLKARGIKILNEIDHGEFGSVYRIKSYKGRSNLCIKYFYNIDKSSLESIRSEYEVSQRLYQKKPELFVETIAFESFEVSDSAYKRNSMLCAYIVTECLEPFRLGECNRRNIAKLLYDISLCLGFMHEERIVHRDIKPSNILIKKYNKQDGRYILCDFGSSLMDYNGTINTKTLTGSLYYMAPEACIGDQSMRSDFYSLGMVCRELILGGQEYGAAEIKEPDKLIRHLITQKKCMKPLRDTEQDSQKLMNIVNKLTAYDRSDRYDEDCLELLSDINNFINTLDKEVIK